MVVLHNLPDFGLDIQAALTNWLARTKVFTVDNFCAYIMSKGVNIIAMSEEHFNSLK